MKSIFIIKKILIFFNSLIKNNNTINSLKKNINNKIITGGDCIYGESLRNVIINSFFKKKKSITFLTSFSSASE
jgi:hypothetical protein